MKFIQCLWDRYQFSYTKFGKYPLNSPKDIMHFIPTQGKSGIMQFLRFEESFFFTWMRSSSLKNVMSHLKIIVQRAHG